MVLLIRDLLANAIEAAVRYLEHSAQLATIVLLVCFSTHSLQHPFFDVWQFLEKVQLIATLLIVHTDVEHFDQDETLTELVVHQHVSVRQILVGRHVCFICKLIVEHFHGDLCVLDIQLKLPLELHHLGLVELLLLGVGIRLWCPLDPRSHQMRKSSNKVLSVWTHLGQVPVSHTVHFCFTGLVRRDLRLVAQ